jgi:hypothetical protein
MELERTALRRVASLLLGTACVLAATDASALPGAYEDKDLSLRLPAALSRFSSYGDVAAVGGASAGSKWPSSVNPAAVAWLEIPSRLKTNLSPQYSTVSFDNGTRIHVATASATFDMGPWGAFQPAFAAAHTNVRPTRDGLDFSYDMEYYQFQWGKRLGRAGLGLNFNYSPAQTEFKLDRWRVSKTCSDTYGLRIGGLYEVLEKVLAGVVLDYSESKGRTVMYDFLGLGFGDVKVHDTTRQYGVRPGISFEYKKDSAILFDYQFARFSNETGRLRAHRFCCGVDHELVKGLFVRGGVNFDARGNTAFTCGLGVYPCDWLTIDVGYQHSMFPELEPELGRAHALTISVGLQF